MNPKDLKERLAKEVDLSHLPEVLQMEAMQGLVYRVMKNLSSEIMKKIPENRLKEFIMVSEGGDSEKTQAFLGKFIFNLEAFTDELIRKEVAEFKSSSKYMQ